MVGLVVSALICDFSAYFALVICCDIVLDFRFGYSVLSWVVAWVGGFAWQAGFCLGVGLL